MTIIGSRKSLLVLLRESITIENTTARKFYIIGLNLLKPGEKIGGWLGIKDGGMFLGFNRIGIEKLESLAKSLELYPKKE
ncbi:MAG: hypothetical protein Q6351_004350 [Candidatus Njordarchaeum guaymaensis]